MWVGQIVAFACAGLLMIPFVRRNEGVLGLLCIAVIAAVWIEKGMGMVVTGFQPSPLGQFTQYVPSQKEVMITIGVYAIGFLVLSVLYKIVVEVRKRVEVI
jgi:molybdopterin-containing oxidoreductase family membrane subunit